MLTKKNFKRLCEPGEKGLIVGVIGNSIKEVIYSFEAYEFYLK